MATYVNDLRLKEIGTGESSGTWGTETNTNLELIGEALGFGTEAITTNADTHTTTVADGSTDPGRAMYLKYTGTLDSACTITIAPNTISRMHFIENATSGSQNIIISQGSGANVTIPAGDVKAVYLDGAGSGAAVTDAFASLNVVDLKVEDDLTVTDDTTIGGTLGVTGVVTANAGVVVDNITIDGTEIDLSSGDLTIDVAGDIILDADGEDIILKDGGTEFGLLSAASTDFTIMSRADDRDLIFKGKDGGSTITALTLDMSAAGAATFNSTVTANAGVVVDNITIDGTEIDLSSGDLTIDVAGDIILDADGDDFIFAAAGTNIGKITNSSSDFLIRSLVQDKDIIFKGDDSGTTITALTLDMSAAGAATFNSTVTANAGVVVDNITIDGTEIDLSSGDLTIDVAGDIILDADGDDFIFAAAGTNIGKITNSSSDFLIRSLVQDKDIIFKGDDSGTTITALTLDMSDAGAAAFNAGATFGSAITATQSSAATAATFKVGDNSAQVANLVVSNDADTGLNLGVFGSSAGTAGMISASDAFITTSTTELNVGVNNGSGVIKFGVGSTASEKMRIDGTGVGIGTTSVSEALTVAGNIANVSGDMTIDVAGDITFDAGGGDILLKDDGTLVGTIGGFSSSDVVMKSEVSNKDLIFKGNDGGSEITALTLDMSAAGAATFNNNVTCNQLLTTDGVTDTGQAGSSTVFNESGSTADFRVESTSNTHMLFVDGGLNRVGINESSPSAALDVAVSGSGTQTVLILNNSHGFGSGVGTAASALQFRRDSGGSGEDTPSAQIHSANESETTSNPSNLIFSVKNSSGTLTERYRILSDGHFLIGTTTNQGVGGISFQETATGVNIQQNMDGTSGGAELYVFRRNSTQIGSINQSSTNAVTYNTSSDARLKDVTGSSRGLDVINNLNPVAYNWKADNHADEGLIAQEVEELVPNAVNQDEDGYYSMDYSKLVTHLVKGMQEQQEQIESLKSEIANLKEK